MVVYSVQKTRCLVKKNIHLLEVYDISASGVKNKSIRYTYDSKTNAFVEKETEVIDGQTRVTTYNYEYIQGEPLSVIDANNNQTTYSYYPNGKVRRITYPTYKEKDNKSYYKEEVYSYNAKDLIASDINRSLCEVKVQNYKVAVDTKDATLINSEVMFCDDKGQIWRSLKNDFLTQRLNLNVADYIRDANNQIIIERTKNTSGEATYDEIVYAYDGVGRVIKVTDVYNSQYVITYNDIERSKFVQFLPNGGNSENHYKEFYDVKGNVITQQTYPDGINSTPIKISKEYDIAGNLVKLISPKGYVTSYEYNPLNQITKVTDAENQISEYTYDSYGNNLSFTQSEESKTFIHTNAYNAANELINTTSPSGRIATYTYDKLGNALSETTPSGKTIYSTYYGNGLVAGTSIENNNRAYFYDVNGATTGITVTGVGKSITKNNTSNGLVLSRSVDYK